MQNCTQDWSRKFHSTRLYSCSTGIKFIPESDSADGLSEMTLTLPAISHSSEWSEYLSVYLPSVYKEPKMLMDDEDDFIFSPSKPPTA